MTKPILTDKFLTPYKTKKPPFGGNGLGEIVFRRTYSRDKEDGTKEEWWETLVRAVEGAQAIGADYTREEAEELYDLMFNLKGLFSGRALWQLGTPLVEKLQANSMNNCLGRHTRVVTQDGTFEIQDLVGDVTLLTSGGKWREAEIRSFGEQKLHLVRLRRGKKTKTIAATAGHRWFVHGQSGKEEKTTIELKEGNRLIPVVGQGIKNCRLSPFGIAHGIVFGDGTKMHKGSAAYLCGDKDKQLLRYFNGSHNYEFKNSKTGEIAGIKVVDLPSFLKDKPQLGESKSYLCGWLAGYFAADGCVSEDGNCRISSASKENLQFVRDVCNVIGVGTHRITHQLRTGIGQTEPSSMYELTLWSDTLTEDFFLIDKHRDRFNPEKTSRREWKVVEVVETDRVEEVFCAVEPETHSFVLEDNILTGNCWVTSISKISDFQFLMDNLMLGGGVGFSVERANVHDFPKVRENVSIKHERTNDADYIVPDSRQGWSSLLRRVLKSYFYNGRSFTYSTILVRGYGAPLKTFGGTASGPEVLVEGIQEICSLLDARAGKKIRSVDALDICNIIGKIVVAGSARRSAQLAAGDPDDYLFLRAKNWERGDIPGYRANSNNSILADSFNEIIPEVWGGYDGSGEPYGFLNRRLARTQGRLGERVSDNKVIGTNPCSEIWLEDGECCNLAEIFLPRIESRKELYRISTLLYKTQKAITNLNYQHEKSQEVVRRNRRLGQGITGWMQANEEQIGWIDGCYKNLKKYDENWSKKKGYPISIKLTTVKPSGTLSLLAFVTPGIHPAYALWLIRRVRIGSGDPLVQYCRDRGYNVQYDIGIDGKENHSLFVVDFPCSYPEGTVTAAETTAIDQLEWLKKAQTLWSDNAVSVTCYYKPEELPDIKEWLKKNYDKSVKSVSFLLHQDHGFNLPPYEPITEEHYDRLVAKLKDVDINNVGGEDLGLECEGGACPIK